MVSATGYIKCRLCGKDIQTVSSHAPVKRAPIICRECFGKQSYGGRGSQWHPPAAPVEVAQAE